MILAAFYAAGNFAAWIGREHLPAFSRSTRAVHQDKQEKRGRKMREIIIKKAILMQPTISWCDL